MTMRQLGAQMLISSAVAGVLILAFALTSFGDEIHLVNGDVYEGRLLNREIVRLKPSVCIEIFIELKDMHSLVEREQIGVLVENIDYVSIVDDYKIDVVEFGDRPEKWLAPLGHREAGRGYLLGAFVNTFGDYKAVTPDDHSIERAEMRGSFNGELFVCRPYMDIGLGVEYMVPRNPRRTDRSFSFTDYYIFVRLFPTNRDKVRRWFVTARGGPNTLSGNQAYRSEYALKDGWHYGLGFGRVLNESFGVCLMHTFNNGRLIHDRYYRGSDPGTIDVSYHQLEFGLLFTRPWQTNSALPLPIKWRA